MRAPRYGELQTLHVPPEVGAIWRSRNDEPEEEEPIYMRAVYETSPADDEIQDFGRHAWRLVESLTPKQSKVLSLRYMQDLTLREVAAVLEVTIERIRQIEKDALRRLRHRSFIGTLGDPPFHRYTSARHPGFAWESAL